MNFIWDITEDSYNKLKEANIKNNQIENTQYYGSVYIGTLSADILYNKNTKENYSDIYILSLDKGYVNPPVNNMPYDQGISFTFELQNSFTFELKNSFQEFKQAFEDNFSQIILSNNKLFIEAHKELVK